MIAAVWLLVFTVTVIADYVWARWAEAIAGKRAVEAGFWGAGTIVTSGAMAISVTEDPWLIIPGAVGAFVGTWFSVSRGA